MSNIPQSALESGQDARIVLILASCDLRTMGGSVQKESDDLDILEVTFDSNMTFEKYLLSVSRTFLEYLVS